MRLETDIFDLHLTPQIRRLMQQTLSPLTGITQGVGVFLGAPREPRFAVCGAELTGMHVLQGRAPPSRSMHIGGCGSTLVEALVPTLAEALERYAQLWAGFLPSSANKFASYLQMQAGGHDAIAPQRMRWFTEAQQRREDFPFATLDAEHRLTWTPGQSLVSGQQVFAPAQVLFLGYTPRTDEGEPWLAPAVTTGTAVHTRPELALRNALLELIQLDCAMGHWYGHSRPVEIGLDRRTRRLQRVMDKLTANADVQPLFYQLPNVDLPGFTIACLLRDDRATPAAVVGLGSDTRLEEAMYKALAEASGIYQLAKLVLLQEQELNGGELPEIEMDRIYDLDLNVAYYAQERFAQQLVTRFAEGDVANASDLRADAPDDPNANIAALVTAFKDTGKELLRYDLTTSDLKEVGFHAVRVWSPDTISLSLPSVPALGHARLAAYGGARGDPHVHPYP